MYSGAAPKKKTSFTQPRTVLPLSWIHDRHKVTKGWRIRLGSSKSWEQKDRHAQLKAIGNDFSDFSCQMATQEDKVSPEVSLSNASELDI